MLHVTSEILWLILTAGQNYSSSSFIRKHYLDQNHSFNFPGNKVSQFLTECLNAIFTDCHLKYFIFYLCHSSNDDGLCNYT